MSETNNMAKRRLLAPFKGDTVIWVLFLLLTIISLIAVYSSIGLSAISDSHITPHRAFVKHLFFVATSYLLVVFMANVNYRKVASFTVVGYVASVVLLILVLAVGGHDAGSGSGRWLRIPLIHATFQPSEFAKVMLILYLARNLASNSSQLEDRNVFLVICFTVLLVVALIMPENLSTAIILFVVCFAMMRFTGVNIRQWRLTVFGLLAFAFLAIFISSHIDGIGGPLARSETWAGRIERWLHPNPDELNQENMARMAVASGGAFGRGIGNTVHARLMTQSHNDFIYAIIIEERGMVMGIIVFLIYAILYLRCLRIVWRCKGTFGQLSVAGLSTMIFIQAVVHMGVSVGAFPVTGQTLPLISAGGTAYLCTALSIGMIQSVAADVNRAELRTQKKHNAADADVFVDETEKSDIDNNLSEEDGI